MSNLEANVVPLESLLARVNSKLKELLPLVEDPSFADSDVRKAIQEVERLSRWKRYPIPGGNEGFSIAAGRAKIKAKENREPFVVLERTDGALVVVSKARLLNEKPFGLDEKRIVFETDKATA